MAKITDARSLFKTNTEFELAKLVESGLAARPMGWSWNPICEKCANSYLVYGCEMNCAIKTSKKYCSLKNDFKYFEPLKSKPKQKNKRV